MYEIVHEFCVKLQLDVLLCQAQQLTERFSADFVAVEAHDAAAGSLSIVYWRRSEHFAEVPFRLIVSRDRSRPSGGLRLRHSPFSYGLPTLADIEGCVRAVEAARMRLPICRQPNLHELFNKTILVRCRERLFRVRRVLRAVEASSASVRLVGDAAIRLVYRLLAFEDATSDEALHVAVNAFTGNVVCTMPALQAAADDEAVECLQQLAAQLSVDIDEHEKAETIAALVRRLQQRATRLRYVQTFSQHFQPLANETRVARALDAFLTADERGATFDRVCLSFSLEPRFVLVVALDGGAQDSPPRLFLVDIETQPLAHVSELRLSTLVESAPLLDVESADYDLRERAALAPSTAFASTRRQLQVAVATIANRLLFGRLTDALRAHDVQTTAVEREPLVGGYVLQLKKWVRRAIRQRAHRPLAVLPPSRSGRTASFSRTSSRVPFASTFSPRAPSSASSAPPRGRWK